MLRLKLLRETYGYTHKDIADYLHAVARPYRNYEEGVTMLRSIRPVQLAERYQVSTDYTLGLTDHA